MELKRIFGIQGVALVTMGLGSSLFEIVKAQLQCLNSRMGDKYPGPSHQKP